MKSFDLAVIGSGPGGYVAALYAARHKLSVCVIEQDLLGGTCLNRGCIPTKSLLYSASIVSTVKNSALYGVDISSHRVDFSRMVSRKDQVVSRLRTGIETLFRSSKIDLIKGRARLTGKDAIDVEGVGTIYARAIIIAAGSKAASLKNIQFDESGILSSDGLLQSTSVPASIAVIGGGAIGCEFASLFNTLGSKVTIIEAMDRLLPGQSREASKKLELTFKKNGIVLYTASKVESIRASTGVHSITLAQGGVVESEKVLIAVGRLPNTDDLGLEKAGIISQNGKIQVNEHLQTSVPSIYAIGDCVAGPQLAHKASYDGILACDNIMGIARSVDYSNVPNCIWTDPEVASVGLVEEEARAGYPEAKIAKFPYLASGKAYLEGKNDGFVKIIGTPAGDILGVEIFGKGACELINEAVLAKTKGITIKDWSLIVHGHPTLSEIMQEAAHVFCGTPIHSI